MDIANGIVKRIKERRAQLGYSFQDVADKTGMSKSTLQRYETGGIKNIPLDKLKVLARALDVPPAWIMGWESDDLSFEAAPPTAAIKILGSVPCGIPIEACTDITGYECISADLTKSGHEYIGLKVKGNSMFPKFLDGDTVIVRIQPDCENGQDCVVYVNGYDATLKRVVKKSHHIILQPLNPEFEPKIYDLDGEEGVKILGVVVELRRKL